MEEWDNQISLEIRETFLEEAAWQRDEQGINGERWECCWPAEKEAGLSLSPTSCSEFTSLLVTTLWVPENSQLPSARAHTPRSRFPACGSHRGRLGCRPSLSLSFGIFLFQPQRKHGAELGDTATLGSGWGRGRATAQFGATDIYAAQFSSLSPCCGRSLGWGRTSSGPCQ